MPERERLQVARTGTGSFDCLALDNRVEMVEPKVRTVTVANTLPKEEASRLLERVLRALPDVQFGDAAEANLVIAPAGILPESNPGKWWLGVGPISTAEGDIKQAKDLGAPFLLEKRNPLLEGLVLGGVVWGGVQPVTLDVTPLISAGATPLLARLNGTRTVGYLLNIDLARSNLGESPDWPILLSNLIELRRDDLPGLQRWNYHLGEDVQFRLYEGDVDPGAASSRALTLEHREKKKARDVIGYPPPLPFGPPVFTEPIVPAPVVPGGGRIGSIQAEAIPTSANGKVDWDSLLVRVAAVDRAGNPVAIDGTASGVGQPSETTGSGNPAMEGAFSGQVGGIGIFGNRTGSGSCDSRLPS